MLIHCWDQRVILHTSTQWTQWMTQWMTHHEAACHINHRHCNEAIVQDAAMLIMI